LYPYLKCTQTRNQLESLRKAKCLLRGAQIFKLCPIVLNYVQHTFPGRAKIFLGDKAPLRPYIYGPECSPSDRQKHPRLGTPVLSGSLYSYSYFAKISSWKFHNTVDWARWRNTTTVQRGPAPGSCIGPRTR